MPLNKETKPSKAVWFFQIIFFCQVIFASSINFSSLFRISMWDVSNENLRSSTYEKLSYDPNITQKMFIMANKKDPNVRLFFNENMIVNYGFNTVVSERYTSLYIFKNKMTRQDFGDYGCQ